MSIWQELLAAYASLKTEVIETFEWLSAEDRWQQDIVMQALRDSLQHVRTFFSGRVA